MDHKFAQGCVSIVSANLHHPPELAVCVDVVGDDAAPEGDVDAALAPRRRQLLAQVRHRRRRRDRVELQGWKGIQIDVQ